MAGNKPYSDSYRNRKKTEDKTDPLTRKKQSKVPALDRSGYINENGLDREDAELKRKNPEAFDRKVGGQITRNLWQYRKYGVMLPEGKKQEPNSADRMKMQLFDRETAEPRANEKVKAMKAINRAGSKQKDDSKSRIKKAWNK